MPSKITQDNQLWASMIILLAKIQDNSLLVMLMYATVYLQIWKAIIYDQTGV